MDDHSLHWIIAQILILSLTEIIVFRFSYSSCICLYKMYSYTVESRRNFFHAQQRFELV